MHIPSGDRAELTPSPSEATAGAGWAGLRAFWWLLAAGALGGALAEAAVILGGRVLLERYTFFNPQGVWLAPIANAMLLLIPFGAVWVIARRWSEATAIVATAFCAAAAASIEPMIVLGERLHPMARLLLAFGVATQVARFARARPATFGRLTQRVTVGMLAVAVTAGIGFNVMRSLRERGALSRLNEASAGAPNVLLLVLDTVRALSLSVYGYNRDTSPFLAELAAQGVRFDRAISTAPWTLPSHASLFTGRYPHELSAGWSSPLDGQAPTLAERLGHMGYATLGVAANLHYVSYEFGLTRGFARFRDYDISLSEMLRTSKLTYAAVRVVNGFGGRELNPGRQSATRINERLLELIDARGNRPFFAFANYYDAHGSYNPPPPYDTLFLGRQPTHRDPGVDGLSPAETLELQVAYDASIAALDSQLRDLFRELQTRDLLRNTLVIVTSDHGEEFNEHGILTHGGTLYFPSVHVPLLIVQPGVIPVGSVVASPISLRDVAATILDAVRAPASERLPGESLARLWSTSAIASDGPSSPLISELDYASNLDDNAPISKGDMRSEIVDGFRFILNGDGRGELFNILADPWERQELAATAAHATRAAAMKSRVQSIPRRSEHRR